MAIITISRGTFGGGRDVAERLASHLNYSCVSREMLIQDTAQNYDVQEEMLLEATTELPGNQKGKPTSYAHNVKFMKAALLQRAVSNRMVYHGHGGHLLLGSIPGLLRVRIFAGIEYRINHAMADRNISREQAIDLIEAIDKKRTMWSRKAWGMEWNDPSSHDLLLSLDNMSVDGAVTVISCAAELKDFKESEHTQQILEDELLKAKVWAALTENEHTRAVRIQLDSNQGTIIISGDVGSNKQVEAVIFLAQSVPGVKKVVNQISVGSSWLW